MIAIYDDIINDLQNDGGISVYWENLKKKIEDEIETKSYNGKNINRDRNTYLSFHRYSNFNCKIESKHIFHSSYYRISKHPYSKNVVTVHDFVYEYHTKGLKRLVHILQKRNAVLNADRIICISENTKKDLLRFYPQIAEKTIKVIYHGVSEDFFQINNQKQSTEKSPSSKNIIFIGKRGGYKNFQIVIDSLEELQAYNLVLVGGGKLSKSEKKKLKHIRYKHYKGISNAELNTLYNNSCALIYPSFYEGFGLPIIESLKAGCPVICHNGSSTSEIGSQYVLKGDITTNFIIKSLNRLEDQKFRQKLIIEGIKYASNFTWDKTAKETLNLYTELWEEFQ